MNHTPHPHPHTIITRARQAGAKLAHPLTANDARWVIGCSLGLVLAELPLGFVARVPPSLLPTVLGLALALLLGAPPALALLPERWREVRRALRIVVFVTLVSALALSIGTALDSARQQQQATRRCLAAAAHIAAMPGPSPGSPRSDQSFRSGVAALGGALCDAIAAARS